MSFRNAGTSSRCQVTQSPTSLLLREPQVLSLLLDKLAVESQYD